MPAVGFTNCFKFRGINAQSMWHASGNVKSALEGARVTSLKQTGEGSPGLPGKLRSKYQIKRTSCCHNSLLASLPKAEQQPNAPGLLFCFLPS